MSMERTRVERGAPTISTEVWGVHGGARTHDASLGTELAAGVPFARFYLWEEYMRGEGKFVRFIAEVWRVRWNGRV